MIRNYFKIAFRNLLKSKAYSVINIFGLAVGFTCCITIGLYVLDELNYDRFHQNGKDIYRVVEKQNISGVVYDVATSPGPLAPALKANFPEISQTCRLRRLGNRMFKIQNNVVESGNTYAADNGLFTMMNFKLLMGDAKSVLANANEIVITESVAEKFFGTDWQRETDLIGKAINFNDDRDLKLVGIAQNCPENSHIQFEVLLPMKIWEAEQRSFQWNNNDYHTYIQLRPDASPNALQRKLYNYYQQYVPASKTQFYLQPFLDIYLKSDFDFNTEWSKTSSMSTIRVFVAVGLIILLIAVFNFINLSTARALKRAGEVGIRKAVGAVRFQLITQFLSEAMLMTFLALFVACILLTFSIPFLNEIASKHIQSPLQNPWFVSFILAFGFVIGIIAGTVPSAYLSRFQPIQALKGAFIPNAGVNLRQVLVVLQFSLSVMLIIGTIVIFQQMKFIQNKNLGFDKSQLISVKMRFNLRDNPEVIKTDLQKEKSIASVTLSTNNLIDVNNGTHSIKWEGQKDGDSFLMGLANVDADYLKTTGMHLIAGRDFDPKISTDTAASAFIVNESAVKRMGWTPKEALGKMFTIWEYKGQIVGVIKDFHFHKLNAAIEPFVLYSKPKDGFNDLLVKTYPNQSREAITAIENTYKKYEKQTAVNYQFVDQALNMQYVTERRTGRIVLYFSILAILISCFGLFGLVTFSAEQRAKEIGIRKVLGASVTGIVALLSKDFLKLVIVAIIIASPLAWYATNRWLQDFAYKINIEWWVFILASAVAVGIALLTVSFQSIKAALTNPVESLRSE
ncbi:ABC transporter permease [Dyadobacter sp. MSC1_007]|jgi:putative ABC transport system permease protein|uniref:ABC transporter permease n=1 Tax=Dyadobacter sp. MSC1_007 TaxID=2909264 RepID=UPI00203019DA|nr:ABC transporter permease [Dyadobacter sp. MSC1_007]